MKKKRIEDTIPHIILIDNYKWQNSLPLFSLSWNWVYNNFSSSFVGFNVWESLNNLAEGEWSLGVYDGLHLSAL